MRAALRDPNVGDPRAQELLEVHEGLTLWTDRVRLRHGLNWRRGWSLLVVPGLAEQPIAQPERGDTVIPVVVRDLVQLSSGLIEPVGIAQRHELVVGHDRVGSRRDLPRAGLHVQGLELLEGVGALRDSQR